jgi:hypothetical protein
MSDDTIAYTDDDIAALHRMLDHKCTPKWWPHKMGETWTCPECTRLWVVDTADHINGSSEAITAGYVDPLTLGWRHV